MQKQLNEFFANFLSKFQCDFRPGFSTHHCLLIMIKKLRKIRDEKGVLLLSSLTCQKPWTASHTNYLSHTKTKCLWFWYEIDSFYSRVLQKTKIGSTFNECLNILFGVPQGSVSNIYSISFLFELWSGFRKLCCWRQPLYLWTGL